MNSVTVYIAKDAELSLGGTSAQKASSACCVLLVTLQPG
jgi:hypothetical protein